MAHAHSWLTLRPSPIVAAVWVFLWLPAASGIAGEVTADVDQFCSRMFGADAFAAIDREDNGLLCAMPTGGDAGVMHHKITEVMVCAVLYQVGEFRRDGDTLICLTGQAAANPGDVDGVASEDTDDAGRTGKTFNLRHLCGTVFQGAHGNSLPASVTRDDDNRPVCNVRFADEPEARLHVFDLAAICGGGSVRVDGETLSCGEKEAALETVIDAGGTGELDGLVLTPEHLIDCGTLSDGYVWSIDDDGIANPLLFGLDVAGWDQLGATRSCASLTGGRVLDFGAHCALTPNHSSSDTGFLHLETTPAGRPVCYGGSNEKFLSLSSHNYAAIGGIGLPGACMNLYLGSTGRAKTPDEVARYDRTAVLIKYELRETKAQCFYIGLSQFRWIFEYAPKTIRFVREEGEAFVEIDGDFEFYGGPVFLEIDYRDRQDEDTFLAVLEWADARSDGTGRTEVLVSRTPGDETLYRSAGIDIEPWTPIADGAGASPLLPPAPPPMVNP